MTPSACDGPLLLNVIGIETVLPTLIFDGAVSATATLATGMTEVMPLAVLLLLLASDVAEMELFTVTLPDAGAVYDRVMFLVSPGLRVPERPEMVTAPELLS